MLKSFGKTLLVEGQSYSIRLAAQLILRNSRRMVALIIVRYEGTGPKLLDVDIDSMTKDERRLRVEQLIQELYPSSAEAADQPPDTIENNSYSEDDLDAILHDESPQVSSIDEIENFIW